MHFMPILFADTWLLRKLAGSASPEALTPQRGTTAGGPLPHPRLTPRKRSPHAQSVLKSRGFYEKLSV